MSPEEQARLIDDLLEGDISEADFLRLEAEMIVSEETRRAYYDRQKLQTALEIESETGGVGADGVRVTRGSAKPKWQWDWITLSAIAALVLFVGLLGWRIGQDTRKASESLPEPVASGFGVVAAEAKARWADSTDLGGGKLLPQGSLVLESGMAQLELFSGVLLVIDGETELTINSAMEIFLKKGLIRVQVPDPARGFRVRTDSGEALVQTTDFAMQLRDDSTDLFVAEGEVAWRQSGEADRNLNRGESMRRDAESGQEVPGFVFDSATFSRLETFEQDLTFQQASRLATWEKHSQELRRDSRLLAYFPMDGPGLLERRIVDESASGTEGTIVRASPTVDRWGRANCGLDFSPTGSRVRLTIPGEHRSLTLMCWVKIDSLDRWYNSLFLTDGHELHEPHWQIMNDGRLFFSVKAHENTKKDRDKHIAYSPPIWTPAQSGQWMHIATVYDGDAATTTHYVNGKAVSIDQIPETMQIEKVEIGPASIGNWGQPKRDDPGFAVRNLNGTIDEFAIFSAALSATEVRKIYSVGRP